MKFERAIGDREGWWAEEFCFARSCLPVNCALFISGVDVESLEQGK